MKTGHNYLGLFAVTMLVFWFTVPSHAQSASPVRVRALKDNTNLRAKPALNVEVAGQMSANQELKVKSMDAEWVEVAAPTNIDFWVLGDYLKDDVVVCRQTINVRAGPGINFSIVGQLTNGAIVEVRGNLADWIKIAPPESCSLWVSRSLVEIVSPQATLPSNVAPLKTQPVSDPAPARMSPVTPSEKTIAKAAPAPADPGALLRPCSGQAPPTTTASLQEEKGLKPPAGLNLIPNVVQGQLKQFEGVLRSKNFLVRSPSDFRLVAEDQDGQPRTVCFVKGNRAQLDALLYRELIISGRQYWVHRQRYPVLVPEKIILK